MILFSKGEIRYCPDFIFKVQLKHYISRFTYCINLNIFSDFTQELSHSYFQETWGQGYQDKLTEKHNGSTFVALCSSHRVNCIRWKLMNIRLCHSICPHTNENSKCKGDAWEKNFKAQMFRVNIVLIHVQASLCFLIIFTCMLSSFYGSMWATVGERKMLQAVALLLRTQLKIEGCVITLRSDHDCANGADGWRCWAGIWCIVLVCAYFGADDF